MYFQHQVGQDLVHSSGQLVGHHQLAGSGNLPSTVSGFCTALHCTVTNVSHHFAVAKRTLNRKLLLTHLRPLLDQSCRIIHISTWLLVSSALYLISTCFQLKLQQLLLSTEHSNAHSQQTTSSHPHFGPRLLLHIFSKIQGEECSSRNYSSSCCLQNIAMHTHNRPLLLILSFALVSCCIYFPLLMFV